MLRSARLPTTGLLPSWCTSRERDTHTSQYEQQSTNSLYWVFWPYFFSKCFWRELPHKVSEEAVHLSPLSLWRLLLLVAGLFLFLFLCRLVVGKLPVVAFRRITASVRDGWRQVCQCSRNTNTSWIYILTFIKSFIDSAYRGQLQWQELSFWF